MRIRKVDGDMGALFRLCGDTGVNYHEFYLERGGKGIEVIDLLIYMTGERFSETMRRMFLMAAQQQGLLDKLLGRKNDLVENLPKVQTMVQLARSGQGAKAMAIYDKLPATVKKEKMCMLVRMQAAQQVGDEAYLAAIRDMEKAFGDDPRMLLMRFDGLFMTNQFDKCLDLLAQLEKQTGPDAYLYTCNANVFSAKGNVAKATEWATKAIDTEPDFIQGYFSLLAIHLSTKSFGKAKDLMLKMERDGLWLFDGLTDPEAKDYAEFVKSPEYKKFLEERPKQDAVSEIPVTPVVKPDSTSVEPRTPVKPTSDATKKAEPAKPAVPKGVKKIVVLKDGREIMATMIMEMGKQMAVKDITGKMHEISKTDVQEVRNP
jgi:hypothetical protein